jgi:hypothetical protein
MSNRKFGRKLNLPSVAQLKHQLAEAWLAEQVAKEQTEPQISWHIENPRAVFSD